MKKLIEYYNKYYGDKFINLEYPKTKKDMYRAYSYIKNSQLWDIELKYLLQTSTLPKPVGIEETILYYECRDYIEKEVTVTLDSLQELECVKDGNAFNFTFTLLSPIIFINDNMNIFDKNNEAIGNFDSFNDELLFETRILKDDLRYEINGRIGSGNGEYYLYVSIYGVNNEKEGRDVLKELFPMKLVFRTYPVNTKVHFLEETDTYEEILDLIFNGYNFVYREINTDYIDENSPIAFYDISDSICIYSEEEYITIRFKNREGRATITKGGVEFGTPK